MFEARQKIFLSCFSCKIAKLCSYFLLIFHLLIKWKEKKQLWLFELKAHILIRLHKGSMNEDVFSSLFISVGVIELLYFAVMKYTLK